MHPALHSWRDEIPAAMVRMLSYASGLCLLSLGAAHVFQSTPVNKPISAAHRSDWIEIERPFPAFTLAIPEAAGQPDSYAIRRHATGNGRKDVLSLGDADGATPYLRVEIYRPGSEIEGFASAESKIVGDAVALAPAKVTNAAPLPSKFGPLSIVSFETAQGVPRYCLGFVRAHDEPRLQISGWFCQGERFVEDSTLACALDRLTLLAAGSEPKVGALFAKAELNRSYCGQREPLLAATPKYRTAP